MRRIKDYGGQASCTQLAVKYGETKNFYNSGSVALAHRVCEAAGIKPATREDGSTQWWTVLYTGRDADKGEDGSFIWKLRDELSEALDQTDLSNIELCAAAAPEEDHGYWWLNANPRIWSFSDIAVGEVQSYTLYNENGNKRRIFQNFLDAKVGDMIIGYESNPVKQIVAIGRISAEQDGEKLFFEKIEGLTSPIDYTTLKECPELERMEYFQNPQGSLFKLTRGEYDFILDMIREENPITAEASIYYMLSYAFTTLNQGGYEDIATEEFENIHNLFAAILAKGIGRQLKQGLYREYLNQKETVTAVRGKIDMPGTIQNRLARRQVLTCEYDELSENNLLNQILKTTVMLLLRHVRVDQAYKSDLKKEMLFFSNIDTIDPGTIHWSAIRFQRNNNTYRMLISLCQLILEGMLLTSDSGEYRLASFIDEQRMNRLYEKFILEYYAKECPQVTATASQIPWALDDGIGTMLPVMQSDIMLTRGNEVLIIDAKYYTHTTQAQYDVHTMHSGNLYQIFTYVKNKEAEFGNEPHQVSGMLLYAATDEAIQPDNRYRMSGNQISVKTLDLNRNFSEISAQLNCIVGDYFL